MKENQSSAFKLTVEIFPTVTSFQIRNDDQTSIDDGDCWRLDVSHRYLTLRRREEALYCLISNRGGLGTRPFIMG